MKPTRPPDGWWEWHGAVLKLAPSEGALATAMAWASLCARWPRTGIELQPTSHKDFVAAHPRGFDERTVRRHLGELVRVGLLQRRGAHSRWGSNVYAPCVPAGDEVNSGQERPVLDLNSGQERPVLPANSGRSEPVLAFNSGHLTPQQRASGSGRSSFQIPSENPPLARVDAPASADARGRAQGGGGGEFETDGRAVLAAVLAAIPEPDQRKLAPGHGRDLVERLGALREAGWPHELLVEHLGSDEPAPLSTARSLGLVLLTRVHNLEMNPSPPEVADARQPASVPQATRPCDHGSDCGKCALCRRELPDSDGVVCRRCDHGAPVALQAAR
jgi:hypothetical protein